MTPPFASVTTIFPSTTSTCAPARSTARRMAGVVTRSTSTRSPDGGGETTTGGTASGRAATCGPILLALLLESELSDSGRVESMSERSVPSGVKIYASLLHHLFRPRENADEAVLARAGGHGLSLEVKMRDNC